MRDGKGLAMRWTIPRRTLKDVGCVHQLPQTRARQRRQRRYHRWRRRYEIEAAIRLRLLRVLRAAWTAKADALYAFEEMWDEYDFSGGERGRYASSPPSAGESRVADPHGDNGRGRG